MIQASLEGRLQFLAFLPAEECGGSHGVVMAGMVVGHEEMAPFCPLAKHNEGEAWHIVCGSFQKPFVCS